MIIGWLIEVMILQEIIFATKLELFQNQEQREKLMKFYGAVKEVEANNSKPKVEIKSAIENKKEPSKDPLPHEDTLLWYQNRPEQSNADTEFASIEKPLSGAV